MPFPAYIQTYQSSRLKEKISALNKILASCTLCPRRCQVNRLKGGKGFCAAGEMPRISAAFPHFGEESCLVGNNGSGTIFFSYCNLKCVFCQNYEISHGGEGREVNAEELAEIMLKLQDIGCHNINLVTPTHFTPQILEALKAAIEKGLRIPLVYNCGGYESTGVIDILDGIIDIYMPDAKFCDSKVSQALGQAPDYFANLKPVLKKMHQQVGDLEIVNGLVKRGLLIRHLVLPEGLAGTREIMEFISRQISPSTYVNIMAQYRPSAEAYKSSRINRHITAQEYQEAQNIAGRFSLRRFA